MSKRPLTLKLPRRALSRADGFVRLLRRGRRVVDRRLVAAFAFKNDELPFARRVLDAHARIWLFRCNQQAFAGDFVAVDMSARDVELRRAWCLDLKLGAPVRLGGGGAGNAFVRLDRAIHEIAREHGVLTPSHDVVRATGDGRALAAIFDVG